MNDGPSSPAIDVFDAIAGFPNQTLCLEAFALIFVPSSATCPSLASPAFSASFSTCKNSFASADR